jgi:predicted O-linked N-acetylglucosamine transferase (SPINDLY family)
MSALPPSPSDLPPYPPTPELATLEQALRQEPAKLVLRQALAQKLYQWGCELHADRQRDPAQTLAVFDRLLLLSPGSAAVHNARGAVLSRLGQLAMAEAAFRQALQLQADEASALDNLSGLLHRTRRYRENLALYEQWLALKAPAPDGLASRIAYTRRLLLDWEQDAITQRDLENSVREGRRDAFPFEFLGFSDAPALHLRCAQDWCLQAHPPQPPRHNRQPAQPLRRRLRVAYLSNDFCNHATAILMARIFELHDRQQFEVFALSWSPLQDEMTRRLQRAIEHFVDVSQLSDAAVAQWMVEHQIDVAVDIKGLASGYRLGILAHRPAPVQMQYLGYPGSLGVPYIDYLIADQHTIPHELAGHYAEKIIRLPHSYQANDPLRAVDAQHGTRQAHGLPPEGVVFASFNNPYKLTPDTFGTWMRILQRVPGSVLWLLAPDDTAQQQLQARANALGVQAHRLVFAPRLPTPQHLARHIHADLFLDTFPVNAHTTAADALWMGLPVLTRVGQSFSSRVGLSLLQASGLPPQDVQALIAHDQARYEAQAVALGCSPTRLRAMRQQLLDQRSQAPLFDAARTCRDLQAAYTHAWQRWQDGLPPEHLDLPDLGPVVSAPAAPPPLPDLLELQQRSLEHLNKQDTAQALAVFDLPLQLHPQLAELWQIRAHTLLRLNDSAHRLQGRADLQRAHELAPSNTKIAWEYALTLHGTGALDAADQLLARLERALPLEPQYPAQRVLQARQRPDMALALTIAQHWTQRQPGHAPAWIQLASVAIAEKNTPLAQEAAKQALALDPSQADPHNQLGMLARDATGPRPEAVQHFEAAHRLQPHNPWYIANIALTLDELGHEIQARPWWVQLANQALSEDRELLMLQAHACERLQQLGEAIRRYELITQRFPQHLDAWLQLGHVCTSHGQDSRAVLAYRSALALQPDHVHALSALTRGERCIADWRWHAQHLSQLEHIARTADTPVNPFLTTVLWNDPSLQRRAAELESAVIAQAVPAQGLGPFAHAPWTPGCGRRLRIGYFSADLHNHATAYLMAQMLESHDREQVEVFAYSWGPSAHEHAYRQRLVRGIEHFHDLNGWGARPIAELARQHGIDVAIDLKGHTRQGLPHIFAWRAAPIQVNYLGYPGTLGAPWIDYIVADHTLVTDADRVHYTEQVVRLPGCYQCNDLQRQVASPGMDRSAAGLPADALVLCCFNATFKISPDMFSIWADLLREVPHAVLWLFDKDPSAQQHLRAWAQSLGVAPERLVFAAYAPPAQHLARYRLADLFLDTLPYNAHTTASDALWVGTPVLTLQGQTFASRVCASLLQQLGLDELIAHTAQDYRDKALALMRQPERLQALRQQVLGSPWRESLFDGQRIAHHMEQACQHMAQRHAQGLPPAAFDVPPTSPA